MTPPGPPAWPRWALAATLGAGLAVIGATVSDYGMSWDEPVHARYGELALDYARTAGADRSCNDYLNLRYYGPIVDSLAALLYGPWPRYQVEVRHAVGAVLGLLTVPALFRLGRLLGDSRIGAIAGASLVLMPQFYGQAFINGKDIPFACAFAWAMAAMAGLLAGGDWRWRGVLGCGAAMGLASAVRPGGLVLLGLIAAGTLAFDAVAGRGEPGARARLGSPSRWLAMLATAWAVMVAPWPWAHGGPILRPLEAIRVASDFPHQYPVLFEGRLHPSDRLPWHYLLETVGIATPIPLLAIAALGLAVGVARLARDPKGASAPVLVMALLWLILPPAIWTATRPNIYDGMRHFLFVLPAMALWVGVGGRAILEAAGGPRLRAVAAAALAAAILWPVPALVRLHPYQMTYFNELVGGTRGAWRRFETDYWVTSYREAMEWINAQARGRPVSVAVAANKFSIPCAKHYADPEVSLTNFIVYGGIPGRLPEAYQYQLVTTRARLDRRDFPDSPVVKTIGRDGAVFAVIKRP